MNTERHNLVRQTTSDQDTISSDSTASQPGCDAVLSVYPCQSIILKFGNCSGRIGASVLFDIDAVLTGVTPFVANFLHDLDVVTDMGMSWVRLDQQVQPDFGIRDDFFVRDFIVSPVFCLLHHAPLNLVG